MSNGQSQLGGMDSISKKSPQSGTSEKQ